LFYRGANFKNGLRQHSRDSRGSETTHSQTSALSRESNLDSGGLLIRTRDLNLNKIKRFVTDVKLLPSEYSIIEYSNQNESPAVIGKAFTYMSQSICDETIRF
jgi:hypothetical protein